jgi:hypothetical protein
MIAEKMDASWSLEGLTAFVYNTPKVLPPSRDFARDGGPLRGNTK